MRFVLFVHSILGKVIDVLLAPLAPLADYWELLFLSVISGILLVLLYGKVSPQGAIRSVKRKIAGNLLEAVLFRHQTGTALRSQLGMLRYGFMYFCYALPPLLVLMVPCIFLLAQLQLRYGVNGVEPGGDALVSVELQEPSEIFDYSLTGDEGVEISPPVRLPAEKKILWRVDPKDRGAYTLRLNYPGGTSPLEAPLVVGPQRGVIEGAAYNTWWGTLLFPSALLQGEVGRVIRSFSVSYPERTHPFLGLQTHWIVIFFLVSLLSGFLGSRIFRVEL